MSAARTFPVRWKVLLAILLIAIGIAHIVITHNRRMKAITDVFWQNLPIYEFNMYLGNYSVKHGEPPPNLSVLIPEADGRNELWFSSPPGWKCLVRYTPEAAENDGAVAYFRCGDPALYEVWYRKDGTTLKERKLTNKETARLARRQKSARSVLYVREIPPAIDQKTGCVIRPPGYYEDTRDYRD